jgi:Domain of Unknown Function (DUF1259)
MNQEFLKLCKTLIEEDKGNSGKEGLPLFDIIAGTSSGAINGALLVSEFINNKNWQYAAEVLQQFWRGHLSTPTPLLAQLYKSSLGESARRYYSAKSFFYEGVENVFSPPIQASNSKVIAMGEFALIETELKPVLKALARSDWNITAVHNHPILEKPSMIFVHWDALGDLNTIINQTTGALMQTSILQGGMTGGDTTSSSAATTSGKANGTNKTTQQQQGNNQTQKVPLEQLGETIFGGQK